LRFARLLVSVIPKGCQGILCSLQVGGGHVIQDHRGRAAPLAYYPTIERVLNELLLLGQMIERRIEVILIKGLQPERLGDSVLGGPADRGEARPLSGDARQDQKQDEFRPALRP
jgi:hypothetical protein